jgi:hypothetical protein
MWRDVKRVWHERGSWWAEMYVYRVVLRRRWPFLVTQYKIEKLCSQQGVYWFDQCGTKLGFNLSMQLYDMTQAAKLPKF